MNKLLARLKRLPFPSESGKPKEDSGKFGRKNEASRLVYGKGKKKVAFELNGDSGVGFRSIRRPKWRGWIDSAVFIAPYF